MIETPKCWVAVTTYVSTKFLSCFPPKRAHTFTKKFCIHFSVISWKFIDTIEMFTITTAHAQCTLKYMDYDVVVTASIQTIQVKNSSSHISSQTKLFCVFICWNENYGKINIVMFEMNRIHYLWRVYYLKLYTSQKFAHLIKKNHNNFPEIIYSNV